MATKHIKNAHARNPAAYYIGKTQEALVNSGATGMQMKFDGNGRIEAIAFSLPSPAGQGSLNFQLPCEWQKFQEVMRLSNAPRHKDDEYCYKVAWANIMDWVEAQMALYETHMVTMPQVFLPFVTTKSGQTLFEVVATDPTKLLGSGDQHGN